MLIKTRRDLYAATLKWGEEMRGWNLRWETGIYPGEMAAFLALCEITRAEAIVESGRGLHAYSTQVLGEYADRTGVTVVSVDMESDPKRGAETRRMLNRYSRVTCEVGDAFEKIPKILASLPGPVALLLDGPKEFAANRLSLVASILFPLVAIGHHNAEAGIPWTDQFARFFPGAFHYEQLQDGEDTRWTAFKTWEREFVHGYEVPGTPGRSLSRSSLVLAAMPAGRRPASALLAIDGLGSRTSAFRTLFKWQRIAAGMIRRAR